MKLLIACLILLAASLLLLATTLGPVTSSASGDDWQMLPGSLDGSGTIIWGGSWNAPEYTGNRFALPAAIPSGATITTATLALYGDNANDCTDSYWYAVDSSDAPVITSYAERPQFAGGSTATLPNTSMGTGSAHHTGWLLGAWNNVAVGSVVQLLVNKYSGLASGAHIQIISNAPNCTGQSEFGFLSYDNSTNRPTLTIEYSSGGSARRRIMVAQ